MVSSFSCQLSGKDWSARNVHSTVLSNAQDKITRRCTHYTHGDPFENHLLGTCSNKHRTKQRWKENPENWITKSPSFPHFSPLFSLSLPHVRQRDSFRSLLREGLIQLGTPTRKSGAWVEEGEGRVKWRHKDFRMKTQCGVIPFFY